MPGLSGLDLLRRTRGDQSRVPVIVITAFGEVETAVDAMRAGAFDYITKPLTANKSYHHRKSSRVRRDRDREPQLAPALERAIQFRESDWHVSANARRTRNNRARLPHGRDHTHYRRIRHGQRTRRPWHSLQWRAARASVYCRQLCGDSRGLIESECSVMRGARSRARWRTRKANSRKPTAHALPRRTAVSAMPPRYKTKLVRFFRTGSGAIRRERAAVRLTPASSRDRTEIADEIEDGSLRRRFVFSS